MQRRLQADQLAAGHQRVERRLLEGDADRAAHLGRLGRRRRSRRPGRCRRSGAAAWSASAPWSSCRPRWGPGRRRSRPSATSRSTPSTALIPPANSRSSPVTSIAGTAGESTGERRSSLCCAQLAATETQAGGAVFQLAQCLRSQHASSRPRAARPGSADRACRRGWRGRRLDREDARQDRAHARAVVPEDPLRGGGQRHGLPDDRRRRPRPVQGPRRTARVVGWAIDVSRPEEVAAQLLRRLLPVERVRNGAHGADLGDQAPRRSATTSSSPRARSSSSARCSAPARPSPSTSR